MNHRQLLQVFGDSEEEETQQMNKNYSKENDLEVQDQKEKDGLEAMDREANSNETQWHSARVESIRDHYRIDKQISSDGEWNSLVVIVDLKGNPLPPPLQGSFTSPDLAIRTIKAYLKSKEQINA